MSEFVRRTRPPAGPYRAVPFGGSKQRGTKRIATRRPRPSRGQKAAKQSQGAEPAASDGRQSAYRTVNTAYRLVDEYLREGQRMA